jgi:N-acetylglucosamine malate deacetylase 1
LKFVLRRRAAIVLRIKIYKGERKSVRVLIVAPHPDDEVLGCGGVMARHAANGDEVHVAVVTRGHPDVFPAESVDRVRAELKEAHAVLGVRSVKYLDFPAPRLDTVPRHTVADAIAKLLKELQPHTMYVPHHGDMHFEHGLINEACLVAARPLDATAVRRILAYETLSETEWAPPTPAAGFQPTVYVDIANYLQKKLDAFSCFRSQLKSPPNPRSLEIIKALAMFRGAAAHLTAAEGFVLLREIARADDSV